MDDRIVGIWREKFVNVKAIDRFIQDLETRNEYLCELDKDIWIRFLDKAIANKDGTITFKFINGKEIIK